MVSRGGRFAIMTGVCACVLSGCGGDDSPSSGAPAAGGAISSGGAAYDASGGAPGAGGAVSSGGALGAGGASIGGSPETGGAAAAGGASNSGGTSSSGGAAGSMNVDTTPSVTGPAITTGDGVLTNLSQTSFAQTGGTLVVTSLYAWIEHLSSFDSIQLWGDIENRGTSLECIPLVTFSIDGYDILTVAYGPAYKGSSTVSEACLPPGGKGVFSGIDNSVSATLLDVPNTVTYSFQTLSGLSAVPHPGAPTFVSPTVDHSTGLYSITGTLLGGSVDIYNLEIDFFIRDSSGLLRDKKSAFPGNLGTIPAGSQMAFSTNGTTDAFSRYVSFPQFIQGVAGAAVDGRQSTFGTRAHLVDQRFADVARARDLFHR